MDGIYKNIEENNPNKKWKILIVFDDMIADVLRNKNLNPVVTELFIRGRKLNMSFFLCQNILDQILCIISLWKFKTNKNFNKLHFIICQILTLGTLLMFTINAVQNHILF